MLYAIRHGETDWNKEELIQGGKSNVPLNATGYRQAEEAANFFRDKNIHRVFSSDLLRARQTTETLAYILKLPVTYDPLLRETIYGNLVEGQPSWAILEDPELKRISDAVAAGDNDAHFPGGESRNQVVGRFLHFLSRVDEQENILIISHGGLLRSVSCLFKGPDEKVPNCGGFSFSLTAKKRPRNIKFLK